MGTFNKLKSELNDELQIGMLNTFAKEQKIEKYYKVSQQLGRTE